MQALCFAIMEEKENDHFSIAIKMEEKKMIISIIGMLIGALVAGVGVYYLIKEKAG